MRVETYVMWVLAVASLGGCDDGGPGATIRPDAAPADAAPAAVPDAAPVDPSRKICDGSDGLRFAYQVHGGFEPPPPGNLFFEPGRTFLFIDGYCHFWITSEFSQGPTYEGVLDGAHEARVIAATHFQSWAALLGPYACTQPPPLDGGSGSFSDGTLRPRCPVCPSDAPAELVEMCDGRIDLMREVVDLGHPMDGPVRITLTQAHQDSFIDAIAWPLASTLEDVVAATAAQPLRIDDLADAHTLRARMQEHDARFPLLAGDLPIRGADGVHYYLRVRDVLPFEDATTGRVTF